MSLTPYLLLTAANGSLLNSDAVQPDPVRFDSVPFPGRPALSSAKSPFFPIDSYECGTAIRVRVASASTGTPTFEPLSVQRAVDRVTPTLFADICAGTELKYVDLVLLNNFPGDDWPNELHEAVGLGSVFTSDLTWAGSDETPNEGVAFDYGQIWVGYTVLDQHGEGTKFTVKGWDRVADRAL